MPGAPCVPLLLLLLLLPLLPSAGTGAAKKPPEQPPEPQVAEEEQQARPLLRFLVSLPTKEVKWASPRGPPLAPAPLDC